MSSPRSFGAMHKTGCREHVLNTVRFGECGKQTWSEDSSQKKALITSVCLLPPSHGSWLPFLSQLNLGQVLAAGCKYSLCTTALQAEGESFPQTGLETAASLSADSHSQLQLYSEVLAVVSLHFKIPQTFIPMYTYTAVVSFSKYNCV